MIVGIGVDICSYEQIEAVTQDQAALDSIFTQAEIARWHEHVSPTEHLSGVFAAKEAVFKAFSISWESGVSLREIEVCLAPTGQPYVELSGRFAELLAGRAVAEVPARVLITISHDAGIAIAVAILEC